MPLFMNIIDESPYLLRVPCDAQKMQCQLAMWMSSSRKPPFGSSVGVTRKMNVREPLTGSKDSTVTRLPSSYSLTSMLTRADCMFVTLA